ncbi:MAG: DUF2961 domain-containing protein [Phycisphaerae bacterium]|jgi:hypothetical protein|nr:DUF2961 domain-containing protein [Phycisphaerae bacterium]
MFRNAKLGSIALVLAMTSVAAGCPAQAPSGSPAPSASVTFRSLLQEMTDPTAVAKLPDPAYRQMQASSYNRASTKRGEPGWFADSDGEGFLRIDDRNGKREWVAMEFNGPGCLTRMWAPYFYRDFNTHDIPVVRIYLDGSETPTIEERWIPFLTNIPNERRSFVVPAPFASLTARAGDVYLPIPFARSCRVTFDREPFYFIINWRAYVHDVAVESFRPQLMAEAADAIERAAAGLAVKPAQARHPDAPISYIDPGSTSSTAIKAAGGFVRSFELHLDPREIAIKPALLRQLILHVNCDGKSTVRCPVGDFFGSPNAINPFETMHRSVRSDGTFTCRWPMPFQQRIAITLENLSDERVWYALDHDLDVAPWDARSMYFHATWRPDRIERGDRFVDLNLLDVRGTGVLVGDQLTALNPTDGWWGEGDEKIYVDGSYERGFPDHFGTGTEDYYGWAGGVNPTWADVFSHPFLANIAVGSHAGPGAVGGTTRGFNICARHRSLDAIPFRERLVFDMEASPGVDQRRPEDRLGYSTIAFWYARPGATAHQDDAPKAASRPIMSLDDVRPTQAGAAGR